MNRDHAFITALTRLLGVFYGIKSLDEACGSIFYILNMKAYMPDEALNPWPSIIGVTTFYILISIAVFFSAPLIAKSLLPFTDESTEGKVSWNDSLIFCSGLFFVSWGTTRIVDMMRGHMPGVGTGGSVLSYLGLTVLILIAGFFFIFKFHAVSKWMAKKANKGMDLTR